MHEDIPLYLKVCQYETLSNMYPDNMHLLRIHIIFNASWRWARQSTNRLHLFQQSWKYFTKFM